MVSGPVSFRTELWAELPVQDVRRLLADGMSGDEARDLSTKTGSEAEPDAGSDPGSAPRTDSDSDSSFFGFFLFASSFVGDFLPFFSSLTFPSRFFSLLAFFLYLVCLLHFLLAFLALPAPITGSIPSRSAASILP